MRTRPYRNPAIIRIIRDMYFVGGNGSFASRHASRFASLEDTNGLTQLQVPKAMVAFVATAVRFELICPTPLMGISSTMPHCPIGAVATRGPSISQPTPTMMFILVTSARWST
jgi:Domain of unknown function (DUF6532)